MATNELTEIQSLTLSRLRRYERWVEEGGGQGYVYLQGYRRGDRSGWFYFDKQALTELLKMGLVECDASPRLHEAQPYESRLGIREVAVKYWHAVPDAPRPDAPLG